VKDRRPQVVNNVRKDARFYPQIDTLTGFKTTSILAVPLLDRDRVLGVIEVLNSKKPGGFNQGDVELLSAFAAHASVALRNAQHVSSIMEETAYFRDALEDRYRTLVGESTVMHDVLATARKAAGSPATILLLGESGVGKEILARSIHAWSPRAGKPFRAVNCAALSEHLLESELFGHEKGSFTGAQQQKKGLFELAHGGTVFLDEIGEMRPDLQAKLLRVLQDHEFVRVGGTHSIRVDIRVIAATNQDLTAAVRARRFRKDLFYRLNVVTITIPPLRERAEDIAPLANLFLSRYCKELMLTPKKFSSEALAALRRHDWPGNVRELENVIERAVVLTSDAAIKAEDIAFDAAACESEPDDPSTEIAFHTAIEMHKRAVIEQAIRQAGGSKSKAALALKLQPTYLSRLCKQFDIARSRGTSGKPAGK
jgi:Nif-specific regulatory protein